MAKWLHEDDVDQTRTGGDLESDKADVLSDIETALSLGSGAYGAWEQHPYLEGEGLRVVGSTAEGALVSAEQSALYDDATWDTARGSHLSTSENRIWSVNLERWLELLETWDSAGDYADLSGASYAQMTVSAGEFTGDDDYAKWVSAFPLGSATFKGLGRAKGDYLLSTIEAGAGDIRSTIKDYCWTAFAADWDYAGNPYHPDQSAAYAKACKYRALIYCAVDAIQQLAEDGTPRHHFSGGYLKKWAYVVWACGDILPPKPLKAFLDLCTDLCNYQIGRYNTINSVLPRDAGPRHDGQQSDMDQFVRVGQILARNALSDLAPHQREWANTIWAAHSAFTQGQCGRMGNRIIEHDGGYDGSYSNVGAYFLAQAVALDAGANTTLLGYLNSHQTFDGYLWCPSPDGTVTSPTHFNVGNHADVADRQYRHLGRELHTAYYCSGARWLAHHWPTDHNIFKYPQIMYFKCRTSGSGGIVEDMNGDIQAQSSPGDEQGASVWGDSNNHWDQLSFLWWYAYPTGLYSAVAAYSDEVPPLHEDADNFQTWLSGDDFAFFGRKTDAYYLTCYLPDLGFRVRSKSPIDEDGMPGFGNDTIAAVGSPSLGILECGKTRGQQNNSSGVLDADYFDIGDTDSEGNQAGVDAWAVNHIYGKVASGNEFTTAHATGRFPTSSVDDEDTPTTLTVQGDWDDNACTAYGNPFTGSVSYVRTVATTSTTITHTCTITADSATQAADDLDHLVAAIPIMAGHAEWSSEGPQIPTYEVDLVGDATWTPATTDVWIDGVYAVRVSRLRGKAIYTLDATAHPSGERFRIDTTWVASQYTSHKAHILKFDLHGDSGGGTINMPATTTFKYAMSFTAAPATDFDAITALPHARLALVEADYVTVRGACVTSTTGYRSGTGVTGAQFGTADFTIACEVRRTSTGQQVIAEAYEDANNYWRLEFNASNVLHFIAVIGGVTKVEVTGTTAYTTTDTWQSVGVSVDRDSAANTEIYLGGSQDTAGTPTVSTDDIDLTSPTLYLGRDQASTYDFDGRLATLALWDGVAQPAAFHTRYAAGMAYEDSGSYRTSLAHWFPLCEEAASACVDQHGGSVTLTNSSATNDSGPRHIRAVDNSPVSRWFFFNRTGRFQQGTHADRPIYRDDEVGGQAAIQFSAGDSTGGLTESILRAYEGFAAAFNQIDFTGSVCIVGQSDEVDATYSNAAVKIERSPEDLYFDLDESSSGTGGVRIEDHNQTNYVRETGTDGSGSYVSVTFGCTDGSGWSVRRNQSDVTLETNTELTALAVTDNLPDQVVLADDRAWRVSGLLMVGADLGTSGANRTAWETAVNNRWGL